MKKLIFIAVVIFYEARLYLMAFTLRNCYINLKKNLEMNQEELVVKLNAIKAKLEKSKKELESKLAALQEALSTGGLLSEGVERALMEVSKAAADLDDMTPDEVAPADDTTTPLNTDATVSDANGADTETKEEVLTEDPSIEELPSFPVGDAQVTDEKSE